jgi:glycosyltransferase involved in cell wall biosynthesis
MKTTTFFVLCICAALVLAGLQFFALSQKDLPRGRGPSLQKFDDSARVLIVDLEGDFADQMVGFANAIVIARRFKFSIAAKGNLMGLFRQGIAASILESFDVKLVGNIQKRVKFFRNFKSIEDELELLVGVENIAVYVSFDALKTRGNSCGEWQENLKPLKFLVTQFTSDIFEKAEELHQGLVGVNKGMCLGKIESPERAFEFIRANNLEGIWFVSGRGSMPLTMEEFQRKFPEHSMKRSVLDLLVFMRLENVEGVSKDPFCAFVELFRHKSYHVSGRDLLEIGSPVCESVEVNMMYHLQRTFSYDLPLSEGMIRCLKCSRLSSRISCLRSMSRHQSESSNLFTSFCDSKLITEHVFRKSSDRLVFGPAICNAVECSICKDIQGMRMLVVAHNLQLEGASLVLVSYIQFMVETMHLKIDVVTRPTESAASPLFAKLAKLGVRVKFDKSVHGDLYDLILINTVDIWWNTESYAQWSDKVIWWVHEINREFFVKIYPELPNLLSRCSQAIFVTPPASKRFEGMLPERVSIIPNPVDFEYLDAAQLQSEASNTRKKLGFGESVTFVQIGTVYEWRHQVEFVQAAINVIHEVGAESLKFVIVGMGGSEVAYETKVTNLIESSNFTRNFVLLPKISHQECMQILSASDVLVSTSEVESFGMTLVEAMAMGKPIITSKVDGVPFVAYPKSLHVDFGNSQQLSRAILSFMSSEARIEHAIHSLRHCERFVSLKIQLLHLEVLRSQTTN